MDTITEMWKKWEEKTEFKMNFPMSCPISAADSSSWALKNFQNGNGTFPGRVYDVVERWAFVSDRLEHEPSLNYS